MSTRATIVSLVFLVIVGGGFVYLQKTDRLPEANVAPQPSTTVWKTYTNEQFGVSFQYPSDWVVDGVDSSTIVLTSPETASAMNNFLASGNGGEAGPSADIFIAHLPTMADYAAEFGVEDPCASIRECLLAAKALNGDFGVVSLMPVGDETGFAYTLPGLYASAYVAFEHDGVYELGFLGATMDTLSDEKKVILQSFTFTK